MKKLPLLKKRYKDKGDYKSKRERSKRFINIENKKILKENVNFRHYSKKNKNNNVTKLLEMKREFYIKEWQIL